MERGISTTTPQQLCSWAGRRCSLETPRKTAAGVSTARLTMFALDRAVFNAGSFQVLILIVFRRVGWFWCALVSHGYYTTHYLTAIASFDVWCVRGRRTSSLPRRVAVTTHDLGGGTSFVQSVCRSAWLGLFPERYAYMWHSDVTATCLPSNSRRSSRRKLYPHSGRQLDLPVQRRGNRRRSGRIIGGTPHLVAARQSR